MGRYLLAALALVLAAGTPVAASGSQRVFHVVQGVGGGGDGSARRPYNTIDKAVEDAGAGDIVVVHRGTYRTPFTTKRSGRPDAPIRIVSGGASMVGDGQGRMVEILHSYVTLERFSITNDDILVWVQGATGVRLLGNVFSNANGECVRMKFFSHHNEVANNRISGCGAEGFSIAEHRKNGEGVYIGTAPEQLSRNPEPKPDASNNNWVHDNVISTRAECVDVKEAAEYNLISGNVCRGSQDPDGAGYSSRGRGTAFVRNVSVGNAGAGIRLGGDAEDDGVHSVVLRNQLVGNRGYGLKVQREPQRRICGNTVDRNAQGDTNGSDDPSRPC